MKIIIFPVFKNFVTIKITKKAQRLHLFNYFYFLRTLMSFTRLRSIIYLISKLDIFHNPAFYTPNTTHTHIYVCISIQYV